MSEPHPQDLADRGLEANLGEITDAQWLAGHRALQDSGDIPVEELDYLYEPGRDPASVRLEDLTPGPDPAEPPRG